MPDRRKRPISEADESESRSSDHSYRKKRRLQRQTRKILKKKGIGQMLEDRDETEFCALALCSLLNVNIVMCACAIIFRNDVECLVWVEQIQKVLEMFAPIAEELDALEEFDESEKLRLDLLDDDESNQDSQARVKSWLQEHATQKQVV